MGMGTVIINFKSWRKYALEFIFFLHLSSFSFRILSVVIGLFTYVLYGNIPILTASKEKTYAKWKKILFITLYCNNLEPKKRVAIKSDVAISGDFRNSAWDFVQEWLRIFFWFLTQWNFITIEYLYRIF